jgi:hypothetical protein
VPAITVSPAYFRGALRDYADWREAVVRELLQNAIDAGASRIELEIGVEDGHSVLVCDDDGSGMTREVFERVFFALGETTKTAEDSLGGFGRARDIVCFAQERYEVRCDRLIVTGSGGSYELSDSDEARRGCRFTITTIDTDADALRRSVRRLVARCSLEVAVTLDGEQISGRTLPHRARRILRDEQGRPWARVHLDADRVGQLLVRVRGLSMFERYLPGFDDVVVELYPTRARQLLTTNRDGLCQPYSEQLDQFISDLTSNRRRALAPEAAPMQIRVRGGGFLFSTGQNAPQADTADAPQTDGHTESAASTVTQASAQQHPRTELTGATPAPAAAAAAAATDPSPSTDEHAKSSLGFDVFMLAEAADTRSRRLSRAWDPQRFTAASRRRRLLLAWRASLDVALAGLLEQHPGLGTVAWTVGWTFDESSEALCRTFRTSNGASVHVLALNPTDQQGRTRFQLGSRASRRRLAALAMHEAVHVLADAHDERFASLLTDLVAQVDPAVIDRAIRAAR